VESFGVVAEAGCAATAEERSEQPGFGEGERIRRPVVGLDIPDRAQLGRPGQRAQVVRDGARQIRIDDEHGPGSRLLEGRGDRSALAAAGLVHRRRPELVGERAALDIAGDDKRPAHRRRGGKHVAQHREREPGTGMVGRLEPLLPAAAAEGDHDLRHRARL
jgi:hypothetical protein